MLASEAISSSRSPLIGETIWILSLKSPSRARSPGSRRSRNCSAPSLRNSMLPVMLPEVSSITTTVIGRTSLLNTVSG